MMLSEEAEETPSSDLLVEPAAEFDVLSIGSPTSTPVIQITYDRGIRKVPDDKRRTELLTAYWNWLLLVKPSGGSRGIPEGFTSNNQFQ